MAFEKGQAVEVKRNDGWVPATYSHNDGIMHHVRINDGYIKEALYVRPAHPVYVFGQEVEVQDGDVWERGRYVMHEACYELHRVLVDNHIWDGISAHIRPVKTEAKPAQRWVAIDLAVQDIRVTEAEAIADAEENSKEFRGDRYAVVPLPSRYCVCEPAKAEWRDSP